MSIEEIFSQQKLRFEQKYSWARLLLACDVQTLSTHVNGAAQVRLPATKASLTCHPGSETAVIDPYKTTPLSEEHPQVG